MVARIVTIRIITEHTAEVDNAPHRSELRAAGIRTMARATDNQTLIPATSVDFVAAVLIKRGHHVKIVDTTAPDTSRITEATLW
jgi:hypothetical protein